MGITALNNIFLSCQKYPLPHLFHLFPGHRGMFHMYSNIIPSYSFSLVFIQKMEVQQLYPPCQIATPSEYYITFPVLISSVPKAAIVEAMVTS